MRNWNDNINLDSDSVIDNLFVLKKNIIGDKFEVINYSLYKKSQSQSMSNEFYLYPFSLLLLSLN